MNQNFEGKGVSIPDREEKRKRDTVDITVATTISSLSLRKLSIYEDPLVWADSREKKGSPTRLVCREHDSIHSLPPPPRGV